MFLGGVGAECSYALEDNVCHCNALSLTSSVLWRKVLGNFTIVSYESYKQNIYLIKTLRQIKTLRLSRNIKNHFNSQHTQ